MMRISSTKLTLCIVLSLNTMCISHGRASDKPSNSTDEQQKSIDALPKGKNATKRRKTISNSSSSTLSKIIQEAVDTHPSIDADKASLSAADDVIDQATAGYLPSIDLRASLGRENIHREFHINTLSPLESRGSVSSTVTDPSITIRQILFDGNGTTARVSKALNQKNQAKGNLGVTKDSTMVDAATAAIDLRRLQRLLRIVEKNIRFHVDMKKQIEEVVQAGAASISDLYQAEARLQDSFVSRANILNDLEIATSKFIEIVGQKPPKHIKRVRIPKSILPESLDAAVRLALDNNSSIKVARSNVQIAESGNKETASKMVPTISLEASAERDRNLSGTAGFQNRVTAMVVARHNLFSGGADLAKSREMAKRVSEAHARLTLVIRKTERTIRSAWGEAYGAKIKSDHLTNLIKEKRNIRETYLQEFAIGKRSLIDILDAANDVFITEATRTTTDASADINTIVLLIGTGQFSRYLGEEYAENEDDGDGYDYVSEPLEYEPKASDIHLMPYSAPSKKPMKPTRVSVPNGPELQRKSLFQLRKEEREEAQPEKEIT